MASLDGVLVVDKPVGPTSHDVVAAVRRAAGTRRVGHTGTLDPFASGVLPLVLGRATRLARFLTAQRKTYRAEICFGIDTDTHDVTGRAVEWVDRTYADAPRAFMAEDDDETRDVAGAFRSGNDGAAGGALASAIDRQALESALDRFRGRFDQVPPAFSAKLVKGVRSYELARRDTAVPLGAVPVEVFDLELEQLAADGATLRIVCGSGFYVRALARDLGQALGCGAYLAALRRVASGEFTEADARRLDALGHADDLAAALRPLDALLTWMPAAQLSSRGAVRASHGNELRPEDVLSWDPRSSDPPPGLSGATTTLEAGDPAETAIAPEGMFVRLLTPEGRLLGIARAGSGDQRALLRPAVVLV